MRLSLKKQVKRHLLQCPRAGYPNKCLSRNNKNAIVILHQKLMLLISLTSSKLSNVTYFEQSGVGLTAVVPEFSLSV